MWGLELTKNGVMDETGKASNAAMIDEIELIILDPTSKQPTILNEAISRDKGDHDAVIVYSTSFSPTPLNYAQPATIIHDQVQDMIGQVIESFAERQWQENKNFYLSMQNAITTHFCNLGVILV